LKLRDALYTLPERVYGLAFVIVAVLCFVAAYSLYSDARVTERRIAARQNDLARVIDLRNVYVAKKYALEQSVVKTREQAKISLGGFEELVSKTFVGGRLAALKPATFKDEKGANQPVVEVRVTAVALSDVISFVKGVEAAGFHIKSFQLQLPENQMLLDMYAMIGER
jgi:hypothetical protein